MILLPFCSHFQSIPYPYTGFSAEHFPDSPIHNVHLISRLWIFTTNSPRKHQRENTFYPYIYSIEHGFGGFDSTVYNETVPYLSNTQVSTVDSWKLYQNYDDSSIHCE